MIEDRSLLMTLGNEVFGSKDISKIKDILSANPQIHNEFFYLLSDFVSMSTPLNEENRTILKLFLENKVYLNNREMSPTFQEPLEEFLLNAFMEDKIDIEILKLAEFDTSFINYEFLLDQKFEELSQNGMDNTSNKDKELIGYLLERSFNEIQSKYFNKLLKMLVAGDVNAEFIKQLRLNFSDQSILNIKYNTLELMATHNDLVIKLFDSDFPLEKIGIQKVSPNEMKQRAMLFKAIDSGDIETLSEIINDNPDAVNLENVDQNGFIIPGETALAKAVTQDADDKVLSLLLSKPCNLDKICKQKTIAEHILMGTIDPDIFMVNGINFNTIHRAAKLSFDQLSKIALSDPQFSIRLERFGTPQYIDRLKIDSIDNFSKYLPEFKNKFISDTLNDVETLLNTNSALIRFTDRKAILSATQQFLEKHVIYESINPDGSIQVKLPTDESIVSFANEISFPNDHEDLKEQLIQIIRSSSNTTSFITYESEDGLQMTISNQTFNLIHKQDKNFINPGDSCSLDSYKYFTKDSEDSFIFKNDKKQILLKSPTIALILDYYQNKESKDPDRGTFKNTYIVNSYDDLSKVLDLCDDMDDERTVKILFQGEEQGYHCNLLVFRKNHDKNEIFILESTGFDSIYVGQLLRQISSSLTSEQLSRTSVYFNENSRQSDSISCSIFSVKDCKHIEKNNEFLDSFVSNANPTNKSEYMTQPSKPGIGGGAKYFSAPAELAVHTFQLPAIFMGLTQSTTTIQNYETKHGKSHESLKNKNIKDNSLMLYAFKERNKENRISTPITNTSGKLINNSADYFKDKYLKYIKDEVKNRSDNEIDSKIQKFDVRCHFDEVKALCSVDSRTKVEIKKP